LSLEILSQNFRGDKNLKVWKCIVVGHRKEISEAIEKNQEEGWELHTYQATGQATLTNHYLLFTREK
jgi:hypothetical protein